MDLLQRDVQIEDVTRTHAVRRVDDGHQVVLTHADVEQLLVAQELDDVACRAQRRARPGAVPSTISKCSGRKPTVSSLPPASTADWSRSGRGSSRLSARRTVLPSSLLTSTLTKFMAGLPMKPATNLL